MSEQPPLKPLHSEQTLSTSKLAIFERHSTESLIVSLQVGQEHCLKARPDGTMLDGHHRIYLLRQRKVNVDALLREIIQPTLLPTE